MEWVVILRAVRTPFGKSGEGSSLLSVPELSRVAIRSGGEGDAVLVKV